MAEGFDDTEMQDLAEEFPEYGDMGLLDLDNEYDDLVRQRNMLTGLDGRGRIEAREDLDEIGERLGYVKQLKKAKLSEITVPDRQTVTIVKKTQRSKSDPAVLSTIPEIRPINRPMDAVEDFIRRNYNINNFRFDKIIDQENKDRAIEMRLNINRTGKNNIEYKPLTSENKRSSNYKNVLTRDTNGVLEYNDKPTNAEAVKQFKQHIQEFVKEFTDKEKTKEGMSMIGTSNKIDDIPGLTPTEMREYRGVMNPTETMLPEARQTALEAQAKEFQKLLDATKIQIENFRTDNNIGDDIDLDNYAEYGELKRREEGLKKARNDTLTQKQREEARQQQEEDITRLQKFKKWAKENMVGLSALSISIAGLITTLIVGARKAIVAGAQATSRFGKAIADLGKKLWPLLGPILGLIGTAISWGATGLAWLASNLWVLAVAFERLIYDQYKQSKT